LFEAGCQVVEGIGRVIETVQTHRETVLEEFAKVTGLEATVDTIVSGLNATGEFLLDTLRGETEVPLKRVIPIIGCVVAAGASVAQGNIAGGIRWGAMALDGFVDLLNDIEYSEEVGEYDFPEELRDMDVSPEQRPFDFQEVESRFEDIFGEDSTVRDQFESGQSAERAATFEEAIDGLDDLEIE
jgi:hypothetical protein